MKRWAIELGIRIVLTGKHILYKTMPWTANRCKVLKRSKSCIQRCIVIGGNVLLVRDWLSHWRRRRKKGGKPMGGIAKTKSVKSGYSSWYLSPHEDRLYAYRPAEADCVPEKLTVASPLKNAMKRTIDKERRSKWLVFGHRDRNRASDVCLWHNRHSRPMRCQVNPFRVLETPSSAPITMRCVTFGIWTRIGY